MTRDRTRDLGICATIVPATTSTVGKLNTVLPFRDKLFVTVLDKQVV